MTNKDLYREFGNIDLDMVEAAAPTQKIKNKKRNSWIKWVSIAACFCICLTAFALNTLNRMDYFEESCSSHIGSVTEGGYYYEVQRDGIYSYSKSNGTTKLLSSYWFDNWSVNEYGIYYNRGTTLYVLPHGSEKSEKLYSSANGSRIDFAIQPNGTIKTSVVGKVDGKFETLQKFFLDGVTGERIEGNLNETIYKIGDREIVHLRQNNGSDVLERGTSILPKGMIVGNGADAFDDGVMFFINSESNDIWSYFIVLADGSNHIVEIAGDPPFSIYETYVIYLKDNTFWCLDARNNESWKLDMTSDEYGVYEFVLDGTTIYSCAPWSEKQTCWKLNTDENGKPISTTLTDDNIMD